MTPAPIPNPLLETHKQAEAEFQPYGEVEIVSTFGEPQAEYSAIRKSVGMMDLPQRGILELSGKDRLPFLNNLLTNETWSKEKKSGLSAGQTVYAFYLNLKGRIVADMNVIELGERTLLEMDVRVIESIRTQFEKYLFAEKVKIESRVGQLHEIALHGPRTSELLGDLPGDAIVWRDDPCAVPGHHVIVSSESARSVWMNLLAKHGSASDIGKRTLRPVGWAAFNAARIEGGRPIFGIDFDDSVLPAETGQLDRAVSFTKGCYLGQEIVARMHARDQLARKLVGVKMEDDALPIAGTQIYDDQSNIIGGVTSSTISPILSNASIALGYVKKPLLEIGSSVIIPAEGKMRKATVVATPFIDSTEK